MQNEETPEVETEVEQTEAIAEVETEVKASSEPADAQAVDEDSATSDVTDDSSTSEDQKPSRRQLGANGRIRELTAKLHEADQEIERLKSSGTSPDPNDYDAGEFDPAYIAEMASQRLRAQMQQEAMQRRQAAEAQIVKQRQEEFISKVEAVKAEIPDYEAVAFGPKVTPYITDTVAQAVQSCDRSAEVAYWLGKNVEAAKEIASMPPMQAAIEIGRIEARLPSPKKVSAAPDPIKPVAGRTDIIEKDEDDMTPDEWAAWRNKQLYG